MGSVLYRHVFVMADIVLDCSKHVFLYLTKLFFFQCPKHLTLCEFNVWTQINFLVRK